MKLLTPTSAKQLAAYDPRAAREFAVAITPKLAECELALRIDDSVNVTAVRDYAEASGIWQELREESGMGSSMMPRLTLVDLESCATVAHISYNGRVWKGEPEDWNSRTEMLYAP